VSLAIFTYLSVTVRLTTSPSLEFACPVQYFTRAGGTVEDSRCVTRKRRKPFGEEPHRILSLAPSGIVAFNWSPTSKRIMCLSFDKNDPVLESFSSDGAQRVLAVSDRKLLGPDGYGTLAWAPSGRVFYRLAEAAPNEQYDNIWSIDVDSNSGRPLGQPSQITTGTGFTQTSFSVSADGKRFAYHQMRIQKVFRMVEIQGGTGEIGTPKSLSSEQWENWPLGWTPDSQSVILLSNRQGKSAIYQQNLTTQEMHPLVSDEGAGNAVVSPDGQWVLFTRPSGPNSSGKSAQLMRMPVHGGPVALVLSGDFRYDCVPQSKICLLSEVVGDKRVFSVLDPLKGRGPNVAQADGTSGQWSLSADGKTIALFPAEIQNKIQFISTEGGGTRQIELKDAQLQSVAWYPDNQHLYVSGLFGESWQILRRQLKETGSA